MLMCITNAVNHGPRRAMASVAGAVTAVLGVMALSAMGLGALLAASETAFTVVKVVGAAYLIWLGIKTFRSDAVLERRRRGGSGRRGAPSTCRACWSAPATPRRVLFFAAFFPQFLEPGRSPSCRSSPCWR